MSGEALIKTLVIPGGAGFIGKHLADFFIARGWRVIVLSRRPAEGRDRIRFVAWDGENPGPWAEVLDGAAAVVNLAGKSVNCRYTAANKKLIYDSRLKSTRVLGEAIGAAAHPPPVWINSSSATIYRHALDRPMDELTGEIGNGFSVDVCQQWEKMLADAPAPQTRKIALRSAMVFGPGAGGVFEAFHRLVKLGLGGTLGPGDQFMSWVHIRDFCQAVNELIDGAASSLNGPVNISSPFPLPNREFMRIFREVCGKTVGLPASRWMLEMGAVVLRTETELLLKSRRVVPTRLIETGFQFDFPKFRDALTDLVSSLQ